MMALLMVVLSGCGFASAQSYTISGTVTDAVDGTPVPGVYVMAGKYGAQTNGQGQFDIHNVPAGAYTVRTMYYAAYTSDQAEIELQSDTKLDFKIKEQALSLGEVVVTGTRTERHLADVPVLTTVIPSREIEKAASVTVLEALEDVVPGIVSSDNAMGNNLRIKGLNSRYILFLVDGERLVSESAGGNVNLDQIDVNQIERIEIVQGAASALYGSNAVGAIINFITKEPVHKIEAGAKASWENPNVLRLHAEVGSRFKHVTLRANAFRNASSGFDIAGGSAAAPYTDYGAQLKTQYKPSDQWKLNLDGRFYQHETFNFANSLNTKHDLSYKMTLNAGGEWRSRNEKHTLRLSGNWDKYFDYDVYERQNTKARQNINDYISARLLYTFDINPKWNLVGGAEYNYESNYAISTLGETPTRKKVDDFNLFAQAGYKVLKNLELEAGARYTYNTQFGSAFTPKFSLMYEIVGLKFRAGVGTAFRAPSIKELYYDFDHQGMFWVYGNPDLKAEKGIYSSFSVEYNYGPFNVSASTYYNRINQKITQYEVIDETGFANRYYKNVSSAALEGFDFSFSYVLLRQVVFKGSYSFCDAVDQSTGLQLEDNVKHSGTASITWNGKILKSPFSLQMAGRFNSPKLYQESVTDAVTGETTVVSEQSKPYAIFKIVLVKPFRIKTHTIEVTFKCDNLFNFKDVSFTDPGRTYVVGLRYAFK